LQVYDNIVRIYVLTAMTMLSVMFWDMMPCYSVDRHQCCGGVCCHHLQSRRGSLTRKMETEHLPPLKFATCWPNYTISHLRRHWSFINFSTKNWKKLLNFWICINNLGT